MFFEFLFEFMEVYVMIRHVAARVVAAHMVQDTEILKSANQTTARASSFAGMFDWLWVWLYCFMNF